MIVMLPALVADQELSMVDWQKLQSYDLVPVRARIRIERKWKIKKEMHNLPDGILPKTAKKRQLIMSKYTNNPMECQQEFPLDPRNPEAISNLFKFVSLRYPQNDWYLVDLWVINTRDGSLFKDCLLQFHLATIQKDPKYGNIKGLKLHKINDVDALLFPVSPDELINADNGYADDRCKRLIGVAKPQQTVYHTPACEL